MLRRQKKTTRISVKQEVLDASRPRTRASKGFKLAKPTPGPLRTDTSPIPRDIIESLAEHLVATGCLRSLAAFNTVSRSIYTYTLPILWRTVIWDPDRKDLEMDEDEKARYWNLMMVNGAGARHVQ